MDFLQRNRAVLEKVAPDLARRLDGFPNQSAKIQVFPSRMGSMTCRALGRDGRWVTLHSTVKPEKESDTLVRRLDAPAKGILVLVGMGLGYPLLGLVSRKDLEGQTILVVERDPSLFKQAMGLFDWTPLLEMADLHFLIGEDVDQVLNSITGIRMKRGFQNLIVIPHGPSIRKDPDFYGPLMDQLRLMETSSFRTRMGSRLMAKDHLTVLVLDSSYFLIRECIKTLKRLGHKAVQVSLSKGQLVEAILGHVVQDRPDFLLSVNHLGFDEEGKLTELLEALKLPFAVWYVDSPTFTIKNFRRNVSPYGVLFIWERSYLESMRQYGFQKTHFLPLATDPSVFRPVRRSRVPVRFRGLVSFVGNSMVEAVEDWFGKFPSSPVIEAIRRLAVPLQMENHRVPMDQILDTIAKKHGLRAEFKDPVHHLNLQAALVWKATLEYRRKLVEGLETFDIRIFGDGGWHQILDGKARLFPPVNYYRELPAIFNGTDVNINATSFQMNSAVNRRVFDAAACGAFLVTDHQPDMDRLFDPEREAVCYEDIAQARDQVAYYLKNRKDRQGIADRARRRVLGEHTYVHRLKKMISVLRDEFGSF